MVSVSACRVRQVYRSLRRGDAPGSRSFIVATGATSASDGEPLPAGDGESADEDGEGTSDGASGAGASVAGFEQAKSPASRVAHAVWRARVAVVTAARR
jgi:hypothetical protein